MKKSNKPRPLTLKQRRFIKAYLASGNGTQAALEAYNAKKAGTAQNIASENLSKPIVRRAILNAYKKSGITDDLLAKKAKEGLNAHETKFFAHEGEVIDERDVVDYTTRARYLEIIHKVRGDMIEKRELSGPGGEPIAFEEVKTKIVNRLAGLAAARAKRAGDKRAEQGRS